MKTITTKTAVALAVIASGGLLAACGSSSDNGGQMSGHNMTTGSGKSVAGLGNGTDLAFVEQMIPHHRSAIQMAQIAKSRSARPQIQTLADNIISAQQREIIELTSLKDDLSKGGVKAGSLGLDASHMGMSMDASSLKTATPFDKAFIDMMTPHHTGAIAMAKVELAKGENTQGKKIATGIVAAQQREISMMAQWRKAWFGSASM